MFLQVFYFHKTLKNKTSAKMSEFTVKYLAIRDKVYYSPALKKGGGLYRIWVVCPSVHPSVIIFSFLLNIFRTL